MIPIEDKYRKIKLGILAGNIQYLIIILILYTSWTADISGQ